MSLSFFFSLRFVLCFVLILDDFVFVAVSLIYCCDGFGITMLQPNKPRPDQTFGTNVMSWMRPCLLTFNGIGWPWRCVTSSLICFNSLKLLWFMEPNSKISSSMRMPHWSAGEPGITSVTFKIGVSCIVSVLRACSTGDSESGEMSMSALLIWSHRWKKRNARKRN